MKSNVTEESAVHDFEEAIQCSQIIRRYKKWLLEGHPDMNMTNTCITPIEHQPLEKTECLYQDLQGLHSMITEETPTPI